MTTRIRTQTRLLIRRYKTVIELGLLLIGILLAIAATGMEDPQSNPWSLLSLALGTSLMASMFVSLLFSMAGADLFTLLRQTFDLNQQAQDYGLRGIHLRFESHSLVEWLEHAPQSVDFMANTGRKFLNLFVDELAQAIALRGCEVRILTSNLDNPIWQHDEISRGASPDADIASELQETKERLKNLEHKVEVHLKDNPRRRRSAGSLEMRQYDCIPYCSILIVDGAEGKVTRHTPYLPFTDSAAVPSFDVTNERGGKLFARYQRTFDTVWERFNENVVLKKDFSLATSPNGDEQETRPQEVNGQNQLPVR